ncbi:MAG: glycosyltransferase [Candidatus Marinimicrobia bacterium]|nr:glycosyltransferase [Candidatus Neomarinimicrobiota bacterium]MCF7850646.1 glycosyltransferase [Candidatus Neomarinimicrobiota bacterium]MCF7903620.1 glycosyltransferase [Candidatus Neomarinimicrobiota bacterium]
MLLILFSVLALSTLSYGIFALLISYGLLKKDRRPDAEHTPDVAVIMAARNEAHQIEYILSDLARQEYTGRLDIYIADDRSTDETARIIDRFTKRHSHFHLVRINETATHMTPKKNALTECIRHSTAEIIVTTDADCRVGPHWVASAVARMHEDVGVLVGYSQVAASGLFAEYQALDFAAVMVANAGMMAHGYHWSGSGQNLAYRRTAFTSIGGYNAVSDKITGDDIYLVQTIPKRTGLNAHFNADPNNFVETAAQESFGSFINQRIRWSSDSRGMERDDPLFFTFLLSAFLSNLMILLTVFTGNLGPAFWIPVSAKFLLEGLVLSLAARKFKFWSLFKLYPVWFMLQPIYITYVGLMGLRGKFTWKP